MINHPVVLTFGLCTSVLDYYSPSVCSDRCKVRLDLCLTSMFWILCKFDSIPSPPPESDFAQRNEVDLTWTIVNVVKFLLIIPILL